MTCRRTAAALIIATAFSVAGSDIAQACACCASEGQRQVSTGATSDYDAAELQRIVFDGRAELFTSEADPGDIRGLSATTSSFDIEVQRDRSPWVVTFKSDGLIAGTLTMSPPGKISKFEVDTRSSDTPANGNIVLYKEWKQTAAVTGTGMFKQLPKGSSASLIFQGRGNGCVSADDFTAWSLVVQGEGFNFHFFGKLAKAK